jgi:hypothetical protein
MVHRLFIAYILTSILISTSFCGSLFTGLGTFSIISAADHMRRPIRPNEGSIRRSNLALALTFLLAAVAYLALAPGARAGDATPALAPTAAPAAETAPAPSQTASEPASTALNLDPAAPQPEVSDVVSGQYHEGGTAQYHDPAAVSEPAAPNLRSSDSASRLAVRVASGSNASVVRVGVRLSGSAAAADAADQLIKVARPTPHIHVLPKPHSRSQFQVDRSRNSVSLTADSVISSAATRNAIENQIVHAAPTVRRSISARIGSVECGAISAQAGRALGRSCTKAKQASDGLAASALERAARGLLSARFVRFVSASLGNAPRPMPAPTRAPDPSALPAPRPAPAALVVTNNASNGASSARGVANTAAATRAASPPSRAASASRSRRSANRAEPPGIADRISRTLLRPLGTVGTAAPPAAELHNTRRMLQIGMLIGLAYLGFLTLWFWRTRSRGRLGRSARV